MKYEFSRQFGPGSDPWYAKMERWAYRQPNWFVKYFSLGFIAWLKKIWIDGKIIQTMNQVDDQTAQLIQQWEEDDRRKHAGHILETGVFGDEGWSIEISNPIVERRTPSISTGMVTPSNAQRLQKNEGDQGTSIS